MSEFKEKVFLDWYLKESYLGIEPIDHAKAAWLHQQTKVCSLEEQVEELQKRVNIMQGKINEVIRYIGNDFDDFYLGETNSDIHKILTVDLEQAFKVDTNE